MPQAAPPIARLKAALFLLALLPLARLLWAAWTNDFGPNPVEFVQRWTGTWTFNLLMVESIPAGAEGTVVARNVVRNLLQGTWDGRNKLSF